MGLWSVGQFRCARDFCGGQYYSEPNQRWFDKIADRLEILEVGTLGDAPFNQIELVLALSIDGTEEEPVAGWRPLDPGWTDRVLSTWGRYSPDLLRKAKRISGEEGSEDYWAWLDRVADRLEAIGAPSLWDAPADLHQLLIAQ